MQLNLHISKKSSNFASKLRDMEIIIILIVFAFVSLGFTLGYIVGRKSH